MKILIAIPVYNEELILEKNCLSLLNYCQNFFTNDNFKIVIADNNSNDNTSIISQKLSTDHYEINYLFLPDKGKGLAWKKSFLNNEADIYLFMDADLAVDLSALKPLIENIKNGADLVLGSRFLKNSKVNRSLNRKIISMLWNILAKIILKTKITDLSCGFKAINQKVKENIISLIKDNSFFADSEMVLLAEKHNYKITEISVIWSDSKDELRPSKVNLFKTGSNYLIKLWQLRKRLK